MCVLVAAAALASAGASRAQTDATPLPSQSDAGRVAIKLTTPEDDRGLNAPLVAVDRFSDAAGTLFRRSVDRTLPAPGVAFSLDDPRFVVPVTGPAGSSGRCYNLDVRPAKPRRYYVFYDTLGNYRIGQFPVIEAIPGDPGYSDLWDIWKIVTPNTFRETNWVRDAATVEKLISDPSAGYTARSTGVFLNAPIVPEGTTASLKGEGRAGAAVMLYAWYNGKRAPFLYLEGSLRLAADGTVPSGALAAGESTQGWPPRGALSSSTWPKQPGYTPLVEVRGAGGRRLVEGTLNCPIVGTAVP
jgi:hypothetical protein